MKHIRKLFLRDPVMLILQIAFLGYEGYVCLRSFVYGISRHTLTESIGNLAILEKTMTMAPFFIVFFLILSYYLADKLRASALDECMRATGGGVMAVYLQKLRHLIGICLGYMILPLACNLAALILTECLRFETVGLVLGHMLLYLFLPSLAMMLLGFLLAARLKRLPACFAITAVAVFSTVLGELLFAIPEDLFRLDLFPIYEMLALTPRQTSAINPALGLSLLPDRFAVVLFWIFLFGALLIRVCTLRTPKTARIAWTVCAIVCACTLTTANLPASKVYSDYNPKGIYLADSDYYNVWRNDEYTPRMEQADFRVTSYDLKLSIGLQLSAEATVAVDSPDLPSYRFTLYHGYKVSGVYAPNGDSLPFVQEGDYLTVESVQGGLSSMTFRYAGSNPMCFSNLQGICLPAGFAYYPISGRHLLRIGSGGYEQYLNETPIPFTASVSYPGRVYSNLDAEKGNSFRGTAEGCTIVAGLYDSTEVDGVEIIYPYLDSFYEDDLAYVRFELYQMLDVPVRRILILPTGKCGADYDFTLTSDGVYAGTGLADEDMIADVKNRDAKQELSLIKSLSWVYPDFLDSLADRGEAGEEEWRAAALYRQAVALYGKQAVDDRVSDYFFDPEETRDAATYLADYIAEYQPENGNDTD